MKMNQLIVKRRVLRAVVFRACELAARVRGTEAANELR
jgi:hypothetical protein